MKIEDFPEYDASQQIEKWNAVKANLSINEKEEIITEALQGDIWGHIDLVSEILFDIASATEGFIVMLENICERVRDDMAQGPFLEALVRIGEERKDMAIELREKIIGSSKNEYLKVVSGYILGGIGLKDKEFVLDLIESNLDIERNPLILRSFIRALSAIDERSDRVEKRCIRIIKKLVKRGIPEVNLEVLNFALTNFSKQKAFFYQLIKSLVKEKEDRYKALVFRRLAYQDILDEKRLFELTELSKDAGENVLNEIAMCLRKYPSRKNRILDLCFYWINKGLYLKIRNLRWVLEQMMRKDHSFLCLLMKTFRKIKEEYASVIVPHIFGELAKHDVDLALSEAIKVNPRNSAEIWIKQQLFQQIIGLCYADEKNLARMQRLAKYLVNETRAYPYTNVEIKPEFLNAPKLSKDKYDLLVDKVTKLVDVFGAKRQAFNYSIISKNVKKYPYVEKYGKEVLEKSKRETRFSPLLGLLQRETPRRTKVKKTESDSDLAKAMKVLFLSDQSWPRAYLKELDAGLALFEQIKNYKYKTEGEKRRYIKRVLLDQEGFWKFISELLIMNRFGKKRVRAKDIVLGRGDIDLEIKLFNKLVLLEVTAPEMDRSLRLSNKPVQLKNKALSAINKKYQQIMKTGVYQNPAYNDQFCFYIVLDVSNSMIDEFQLLNSLFGSLTVNWQVDRTTGKTVKVYSSRAADSLYHRNERTEIVSGVIYFKKDLAFDRHNKPFIKLSGDVINSPMGKMKLSETEIERLKEILFKSRMPKGCC